VLEEPTLKGLLRRIVGKIFNDIELKGWCSEFEARNAAGREAGADAAAVVGLISSAASSASATTRRRLRQPRRLPDLYYTVFGLEGMAALRAPIDVERTRGYLADFGDGAASTSSI
jgi:hypothetical protein